MSKYIQKKSDLFLLFIFLVFFFFLHCIFLLFILGKEKKLEFYGDKDLLTCQFIYLFISS